jgi:hypothetical protein
MNNENINHKTAFKILFDAYTIASTPNYQPCSKHTTTLKYVLNETHLTYKYIMVNSFVAKATLPNINPLCLQKKSKLQGAYDARSICHKVLVPFERKFLNNGLGGSNEPFLNKPARFPELSITNAVRKGRDSNILSALCDLLPEINSPTQAFTALTDSLYYILELVKSKEAMMAFTPKSTSKYNNLESFFYELLSNSCQGESLALAIGILTTLHSKHQTPEPSVTVHVVNQAGSSSKEISDIDVYISDTIAYGIEVKDKTYANQDVLHAVRKAMENKCPRLIFLFGPNAKLNGSSFNDLVKESFELGVYLTFIDSGSYIRFILSTVPTLNNKLILEIGNKICKNARLKEETINHYLNVAMQTGMIE